MVFLTGRRLVELLAGTSVVLSTYHVYYEWRASEASQAESQFLAVAAYEPESETPSEQDDGEESEDEDEPDEAPEDAGAGEAFAEEVDPADVTEELPTRLKGLEIDPNWRCVFIDTDGSIGQMTHEFHTYTPFAATGCIWEVWHFGAINYQRKLIIENLKLKPNVKVRIFTSPAEVAETQSQGKDQSLDMYKLPADPRVNGRTRKSGLQDLAMLMLANLHQDDFIELGLHADRCSQPQEDCTVKLVERMNDLGVSSWVDKWLIDSGHEPLRYRVPQQLWDAIEQGVPDLERYELMDRFEKTVRAAHRVTHLAVPLSARQPKPGRNISRFWQSSPATSVEEGGQRHVFIDCGTNRGDTIYQFLTYVPNPQRWEVWGFEAVPSLVAQAGNVSKWIEANYPLGLEELPAPAVHLRLEEREQPFGLQRIHIMHAVVWTNYTSISFNTGRALSGSVLEKRNEDGNKEFFPAVDIADWIRSKFKPTDFVFLKMDIEGAEYTVLPHMMGDGVTEWISKWALEFHFLMELPGSYVRVRNAFFAMVRERGVEFGQLE